MAGSQQYAHLANRVYDEPNINAVYAQNKPRYDAPDGHHYEILEHASNPQTGYQGTIYQDINSGEIIVAHRGTKGGKDIGTDINMVRSKTNNQIDDAMRLVEHAKDYAEKWHKANL